MKLNIVSLDNPYPPDYGGAIDIYYKLKYLSKLGCKINLHYFYSNRNPAPQLEDICDKVYYYPRKSFIKSILNIMIPYVVSSRNSKELISNLSSNNYPILFDGLQCSLISKSKIIKNRKKYLRLHNIESEYMKNLSFAEQNWVRKIGLRLDSFRYKSFEKKINQFETIFTISEKDQKFYKKYHPNVQLLNVFHGQSEVQSKHGMGDYIFYHGNFDVSENLKAAKFLISKVFNNLHFPIKIAGKNALKSLQSYITNSKIELVDTPSLDVMQKLIMDAHINILPTFQATGVKLKLINSLYLGRHCIVNNEMISPTPQLIKLCSICNSAGEFINIINEKLKLPFSEEDVEARESILQKYFDDFENSKILTKHFFDE